VSVVTRKSWQDLRRRKARSLFTLATIGFAVASLVTLVAMPQLMDRAVEKQIIDSRLHDIQFFTEDVDLGAQDLALLAQIDGVDRVDARTLLPTRVRVGDRREDVLVIGVQSFEQQAIDVVSIDEGSAPGLDAALTDPQNRKTGRFDGRSGSTAMVEDSTGQPRELSISGDGSTLVYSQAATELAVLYVPQATADELAGAGGVNSIELTVDEGTDVAAIADDARSTLLEIEPAIVFSQLPDVREAGTWPGQDIFENFATLFYVGAALAVLSAMVLISNTMTTMVAEQVREVAVMKAIGGRRRQIIGSFLSTVLLLAALGSLAGVALGIPLSNLLVGFVAGQFFGLDPGWEISGSAIVVSFVFGVVVSTLAALPALRRAVRISVREGLDASQGLSKSGWLDRLLRRTPLPHNAAVGLRNTARRRARFLGTVLQIGLAVGVALGFVTLGVTVTKITGDTWDVMSWDVLVIQGGISDLDETAGGVIAGLDGVAIAHPTLYNSLEVDGQQLESWGLPPDTPLFEPDILSGRWLEPVDDGKPVAVLGRAIAATSGSSVGDTLTVGTSSGTADLEVIGIDGRLMNNGTTIYLPLGTFQDMLERTDTNIYWVESQSQAEADIDRLAASAEDQLASAGYQVRTEIHYVGREANLAANRVLVNVLALMGIPIVAIGMIGLVNLMTMNVIERTREIGILRCIGAKAGDIRRIFLSEGLAVAFVGWVLAAPLGWAIGRTLVWIVAETFNFGAIPYEFPLWYLPVALAATLVLAALVVIAPVRRAAKLRPGEALRYE